MTVTDTIDVLPKWYETTADAQRSITEKFKWWGSYNRPKPLFPNIKRPLKYIRNNDYRLITERSRSVWIEINDLFIRMRDVDDGVAVEIIRVDEDGRPITIAESFAPTPVKKETDNVTTLFNVDTL